MSVIDFSRHALFHLTGTPKLASRETLGLLHTPVLGNYALGWSVIERSWAKGKTWTHQGSNTFSYASVWIAPALNFAAVGVCNSGIEAGFRAVDDAIGVSLDYFSKT